MPKPLVVPRLQGPGTLVLRPWDAADLPAVRLAAADPLIPLITSVPDDDEQAACRGWITLQHVRARDRIGWSFAVDDGHGAVGQIGLWPHPRDRARASLGYWLVPSARGTGLARAAVEVLAGWATEEPADPSDQDRPLERLEIYTEPWNTASWRTAEHCGFRREGLLRSWETVGGTRRDMYMYARLRSDRAQDGPRFGRSTAG